MGICTYTKTAWAWLRGLLAELLAGKHFGHLLALAASASLIGGTAMFIVDPNIHSLWDGVWYAWVTMTHVGFGDVVPTSFLGRALASVLILFGIALMALLFALFSALLIARDVNTVEREESEILAELKRLHERLEKLEGRPGQGRQRH